MRFVRNSASRKKEVMDRPYENIADRLNEWKLKQNVPQTELSEVSEQSMATIQRVYMGTRAPSIELLQTLREKYNVDLNWLICGK